MLLAVLSMKSIRPTDEIVREYDTYYLNDPHKWAIEVRNQFMLSVISEPKRLLDIGCGNGHTLVSVSRVYPDANLYGVDLSGVACRLTREKLPDVEIFQGLIEDYKPDVKFDWVLCLGVAEHFEDVRSVLRIIRKIEAEHYYFEIPNNLKYSRGGAGYRRLSVGSKQWEWHLPRHVWVSHFVEAGFVIEKTLVGKKRTWEFIWTLI